MRQQLLRLAWITDPHLNFLNSQQRRRFLETARDQADAFLISGDIAEAPTILDTLSELEDAWQKPIHFVLGNHDFYHGSITKTRADVHKLTRDRRWLSYLTTARIVPLSPRTALVGHDGWADARFGDFEGSTVLLNDYLLIDELRHWKGDPGDFDLDKAALREGLQSLAGHAAAHFERLLQQAAAQYPSIIAVTHVPPFQQAAWYAGRQSDDNYLPHFACQAVGQAMQQVMRSHPESHLLVLCGHTHGSGEVHILENLRVLTGGAEYGHPVIQQIFEIE